MRHLNYFLCLLILSAFSGLAQPVTLYKQFNGRQDFVFIGNTMNLFPNETEDAACMALTQSSATLALNTSDQIKAAYLYWAGAGPGDFEVKLNGSDIVAQRTFVINMSGSNLPVFSGFADVSSLVKSTGNSVYTLSELDVNPFLEPYCDGSLNFAGWALVVVYENPSFPTYQLNIYDGMQTIPQMVNINLDNLSVADPAGSKIGFIAWEGDKGDPMQEYVVFNNDTLSNAPLNPFNDVFNGTNSFTGADNLYNMDLDVFDISSSLSAGDTSANLKLISRNVLFEEIFFIRDVVNINVVVTRLSAIYPDAEITAQNNHPICSGLDLTLDYTVSNLLSSDILPAGTPIAFYLGDILLATSQTNADIPVDGSQSGSQLLTLPSGTVLPVSIKVVVDDNGTGSGQVTELNEDNNTFFIEIPDSSAIDYNVPPNQLSCNLGNGRGIFDLSGVRTAIATNPGQTVRFFESSQNAFDMENEISDYTSFEAATTPKTIFVRIDEAPCFTLTQFELEVHNCPPTVYNFISVNGDGKNDTFIIKGLYDIFLNFQLFIYNRWGTLIWTGNNKTAPWDGQGNEGIRLDHDKVPDGTYYYILELNDPDYPKPLNGFLYITH
ncbi:gliding motility-associated C-terminal domain-containing protein [Flavobacterium silvaticum]|uniref:Gliding motility-associated C-terminal domain-containing protein n=1 Tax=Flavobacterium silvaticum TaxID=1852020 RepID=A0A972JEA1_9FLAO|nr:gliding motility-associated C-terminal domain-containing protein [Flavobacterium silvaticum]NMH26654.1 gliding motility-associated C-terminal domain-containing protein [Flavobacterium silvaticum]